MKRWTSLSFVLALAFTACARHGTLTPKGLEDAVHGYEVVYADANAQRFLPESWRLDNYYKSKWENYESKDFGDYVTRYSFDLDGDGEPNTVEELPTYALRFEHTRTLGVIWLRAIPLPEYDGDKELRGLARSWGEARAGTAVDIFRAGDHVVLQSLNLATKQIEEAPAKGPRENYLAIWSQV